MWPLISVVIPCYNVEKYLKRCVSSILRQTYNYMEIILVDDGSTDTTAEIIECLKEQDKRISVIHQKNRGLSGARNSGIEIATGDYITFIDSDDYVADNFIEYLKNLMIQNNSEVSIVHHQKFYDNQKPWELQGEYPCYTMNSSEALKELLYRTSFNTSAWGKMYRRELFCDIRYPEGLLYEDLATTYKLLGKSNCITFSPAPLYYYYQRKGSIINSRFNSDKLMLMNISYDIRNYIQCNYPDLEDAANSRVFISCVQTLRAIPFDQGYKISVAEIGLQIKKIRRIILLDKNNKISTRFLAFMSYFGLTPLRCIGKISTLFIRLGRVKTKF